MGIERAAADINRRDFLKAASAAAALVPTGGAISHMLEGERRAAAVRAGRAHGDAILASVEQPASSVSLGGANVRPPAVPLAVRSPYLSTWLPSTTLTAAVPQFWPGAPRGFAGLVVIDGVLYAWGGQPTINGAAAVAMAQTSLVVTATRSIFTFSAGGVGLRADWLSPIEPGDLMRESVPFTLLTVTVSSIDGGSHSVQLYADITGEWASSNESAEITWNMSATERNRYWSIGLQAPEPLTEFEQMAMWGTAVWGSPLLANQTYQSGSATDVRGAFATAGSLPDTVDTDFRAVGVDQPVFAFANNLGTVSSTTEQSVTFVVGHVRSPLLSYGPTAVPLLPWWSTYWQSWTAMADFFLEDAPGARTRAIALDSTIETAARAVAGTGYSALCALAARQCYGGMEVAVSPSGGPWVLGKEISSGGYVNTVDIFDQAYLMWLWLDPAFVPLEMEPVLTWCASTGWQADSLWTAIPSWQDTQTKYCVHDLGPYPVASGRPPGNGEQMPVEECAGMLIMAASYAERVGATTAAPFLESWQELWSQWAGYLLTQVPTPAMQLTTDDWVPEYARPTGGTNLAMKAILGLAAAGQIATILGDTADATTWSTAASDNVEQWLQLSLDPSGDYVNLEQGASGTWTTLYNAFYEEVIGENLVPTNVSELLANFYLTKLQPYGMPLQTDCGGMSKVVWSIYTAAWLADYPVASKLLSRAVNYVNETPALVPYSDRYNTDTGIPATGVAAHPTVGGVFAMLCSAQPAGPASRTQRGARSKR